MDKSPAIALEVDVKEEMLLVLLNGKEIARHPGIAPDQLENVASKNLCGLEEANEGFAQIVCLQNWFTTGVVGMRQ